MRTRLPVGLLALVLGASFAVAQDSSHGWLVSYTPADPEDTGLSFVPVAAFALEQGETFFPGIDDDYATVVYGGTVVLPEAGRYRFGFEAEGCQVQLRVNRSDEEPVDLRADHRGDASTSDPVLTDWVDIEGGEVRLGYSVIREGRARFRFRAMWERERTEDGGFDLEPIPTSAVAFSHPRGESPAPFTKDLRGLTLLERKGCTNCHDPEGTTLERRPAPLLDGLAARVGAGWLGKWLAAPHVVRPGADMPSLVAPEDVEPLSHFLLGTDVPAPPAVATEARVLADGRDLYHTVGCVACHGPLVTPAELYDDEFLPDEIPAHEPVAPFGDLTGKWRPDALSAFLREPRAVHPDGRMPSLALDEDEADRIATWLVSVWGETATGFAFDAELAEQGRAVYESASCAACHEPDGPAPAAPALKVLDPARGCLDPDDAATPRYDLSDGERAQLAAGLEAAKRDEGHPVPLDAARRTMAHLSCTACHRMDGGGGIPEDLKIFYRSADEDVDLGDEGRLPPSLVGAGHKLTTRWMERVFFEHRRARPYLAVRMPRYGTDLVYAVPEALSRMAGVWPHTDAVEPEVTDDLVRTGRELLGRRALGCVACHVYRDYPPAGTPGPALTQLGERLRYEWYSSYMHEPRRFVPGTRMPASGQGGRSTLTGILGGDFQAQLDAMWAYFSLGEFAPPPPDVEPARAMKIDVGDRPVVLRTFLENAGSRGIAVGLPVGVHFGYDAGAARLVEAWQGDFLDASGAWAGRGGQIAGGRGATVWTAPAGPTFVVADEAPASWPAEGGEGGPQFAGYLVDAAGHPTFVSRQGGFEIEERFSATLTPQLSIRRSFRLVDVEPGTKLWMNAGTGFVRMVSFENVGFASQVRPGERTWFELDPFENEVAFELVIEP